MVAHTLAVVVMVVTSDILSIGRVVTICLFCWFYYCLQQGKTRNKQILEALQDSEQLFSAMFNQAAVGIAQVRTDGQWLQVNQKLCDIVGYTNEELSLLTFQDITHPDDLDIDLDYVRQILAGTIETYSMEKRYIRKDLSEIWINLNVSLVRDASGKPQYFISVVEDISERKRVEKALKITQFSLDSATDAIFWLREDLRFAHVNDAMCRKLGYSRSELLSMSFSDIDPDVSPSGLLELQQTIKQQGSLKFESHHRRQDGSIFPVEIVANYLQFDDVEYICCFSRDISDRKRIIEALRESEQRWRILSETLPIGVVLVNPNDASFVDFNDAAAINLGYRCDEFANLTLSDIDISLNREEILNVTHTLAEQNEGVQFETQHRTKNGEIKDVRVTGKRIVFNDSTLIYGVWVDITQKRTAIKQLEQALIDLQHSEQRYRSLLTATTQIIWTTNAQGEVIEDMPGWRLITGQSAEEMKGWGWLSVIHPDDQEHTSRLWNQALQTKTLYEVEHRLRIVDGSYQDFSVRAVPVLDDDGEVVEWIGTHTDVTEKKQAQQALEMTQFCVDSATDAISWIKEDLSFAYVNDAMCRYLGYSRLELLAIGISEIDLNISLEGKKQLWQAMKQGGSIKFETLHTRKDGSIFPVEIIVNHLQFDELEYACCFARDISERKQTEAQLQKSYNLLQTVIEGTPDAIFAKDLQGRYLLANSTSAAILDKPVAEILNKDDRDFLPPEMARIIRETDRQIMTTGANRVLEEVVLTNGELRTYLSAKSVWRDVQGNIIGLVGIGRDITERKLAEEEIKALNEDLERRVIERTAELTAANQELEAFSYSVSHDLRAPLRGIDGFSQALMDRYSEQLDDKAKHYLTRIRAGTQRMGELIDDLLTLSRVTRTEMRRRPVDLSAIASEIATELKFAEPERHVEFAIASELVVNGDVQLLRVVLENLLNNAWKFTSTRIQSKIEFNVILQTDAKVAYFIRDNGAGFDMAYSNKLFGAFQRLHSTSQFPGTGVGLATVQRIIHRHGGKVWAEGTVEQGATFYFTL